MVLGICGLVVCPLICSILALVFGYQGRAEIDRSGGLIGGRGQATAGIAMGWVGVAVGIALVALIIVLAATGELDEDDDVFDSLDEVSHAFVFVGRALGGLARLIGLA